MKIKKTAFLILSVVLLLQAGFVNVWGNSEINVIVDGQRIIFDQPPINRDGRVLVPVRPVAEALGWEVNMEPDGQIQLIRVENTERYITYLDLSNSSIQLFIASKQIIQFDEIVPMLASPIIQNGRTLIGIRDLAESLYAEVTWQGETNTVIVTSKELPYATSGQEADGHDSKPEIPLVPDEKNNVADSPGTSEELALQQAEFEAEIIRLVNEYRKESGLNELIIHEGLMEIARWRAEENVKFNSYEHLSPTYNLEHTELVQYLGVNCKYAGELLVALEGGIIYPAGALYCWQISQPHNKALLNNRVVYVGAGYCEGCYILLIMF